MDKKTTATPPSVRNPHAGHLVSGVVLAAALVTSIVLGFRQIAFAHGSVVIDGKTNVRVSVASNDRSRERGLSGKKGLAADEGMLFIFDRSDTYGFWMKDMKFPIDIIWINDETIADLSTDVPIPTPGQKLPLYFPRIPVDKVLEVPAGFALKHGLKVGMDVDISVDKRDGVR